jgi:hypothetical protein
MNDISSQPVAIVENTTTVSRTDLAEAVRATALLADLTISMWSVEKTDRTIGDKLKEDAGAIGNTGRYVKNLLAGCDTTLKGVKAAYAQARNTHYTLTLPWVSNPHAERQTGSRLLPNLLFERYLTEMSTLRRAAEAKLAAFCEEYPDLVTQAMANLAGLAQPTDYPSVDQVQASFKLSFDFTPIPAGSAFQGLRDDVLTSLSKALQRKQEKAVQASQAAMWERVREATGHLIERLSDQDKMFKASTVESVRELITLLPGFNCAGDPRVHDVVADIQSMLDGVDAEALRKDAGTRSETARRAQALTDKLNAMGV